MEKFALESVSKDGLLCDGEDRNYVVTTEFNPGDKYEGQVKLFDSLAEARAFIEEKEFWGLSPIKYTNG